MGDSNPKAIFGFVADELAKRKIAFIFVREIEAEDSLLGEIKRRFGGPVANELMSKKDGKRLIETGKADALAFGRDYIANPDLAERLQQNLPLNTPKRTRSMAKALKATQTTPGCGTLGDSNLHVLIQKLEVDSRLPIRSEGERFCIAVLGLRTLLSPTVLRGCEPLTVIRRSPRVIIALTQSIFL